MHYFDNKQCCQLLNISLLFLWNRTMSIWLITRGKTSLYSSTKTTTFALLWNYIYYIWKGFEKWIYTGRQNQYLEVRNTIFFVSVTCLIVVSNKTCTVLHLTLYKWLLSHDICYTIGSRLHGMICVLLF